MNLVQTDRKTDMSDLPQIDQQKVAERLAAKQNVAIQELTEKLNEANYREAQLEILAEALRDQRDVLQEKLDGDAAEAETATKS